MFESLSTGFPPRGRVVRRCDPHRRRRRQSLRPRLRVVVKYVDQRRPAIEDIGPKTRADLGPVPAS